MVTGIYIVMWHSGLREEIEEMFARLEGVPDIVGKHDENKETNPWRGIHTGLPKDVGIRVRRFGRDPEKVKASRDRCRERHREYNRERNRRIRFARLNDHHEEKAVYEDF